MSTNDQNDEAFSFNVLQAYERIGEPIIVEDLMQAKVMIELIADHIMDSRYGPEGREFRPFHNTDHTHFMDNVSMHIFSELREKCPYALLNIPIEEWEQPTDKSAFYETLDVLEVYQHALNLAHDTVQNVTVTETGMLAKQNGIVAGVFISPELINAGVNPLVPVGGNEGWTAAELYQLLSRFQYSDGRAVFEIIDEDRVFDDIEPTITPFFKRSTEVDGAKIEYYEVIQAFLTEETPLTGVIAAFADINSHTAGTYDEYTTFGNAEFRERNHWIMNLIDDGIENIKDPAVRVRLLSSLTDWYKSQYFFAKTRLQNVKLLIDGKTDETGNVVGSIFKDEDVRVVFRKHFDYDKIQANIDASQRDHEAILQRVQAAALTDENFENIARVELRGLGYVL